MTEIKQVYLYRANGLTATVVILVEARNASQWVRIKTAFGEHWVDERELEPVTNELMEKMP